MKPKNLMLIGMFSLILMLGIVSAQTVGADVAKAVDNIAEGLKPIFSYTLGGDGLTGELLFVKVLLFIIMIAIVYRATTFVPGISENRAIVGIITLAISILATRFISTPALVNFLWLPQGVLGIALVCFFPFIIFFFFIESFQSGTIRKIGWSLFAIIFFFLAIIRWEDLNQGYLQVINETSTLGSINLGWIYILTAIISILAILFDKLIHSKVIKSRIEARQSELNYLQISKLNQQIEEWNRVIADPAATSSMKSAAERRIAQLRRDQERLARV